MTKFLVNSKNDTNHKRKYNQKTGEGLKMLLQYNTKAGDFPLH